MAAGIGRLDLEVGDNLFADVQVLLDHLAFRRSVGAAAAAFVHHPQLVAIQRRETARLLAAELPLIDRVSLEAETNRLADVYLLAFEREADRVIPSYDIEFE